MLLPKRCALVRRLAGLIVLLLPLRLAVAAEDPGTGLTRLARQAEVIAFGHCQSAESSWDEQHRFIITTIHFQPRQTFKGAAADSLTVKVLGGQLGTEGMTASHSAALTAGETAVLFLQHSRFGDYFIITGGADGKLAVGTEPGSGRPLIRGALSLDDFGRLITGISERR